jgi:signal transduction histidine kinase/serine phosphatase RsbU (regulator of sigma subunit)/DNA-binding NarL/FixJ family response regulator
MDDQITPVKAGGRDGDVGQAVRDFDWGRSPLGFPEGWPVELSTVIRTMLGSRFSMWMGWGPELTFFYNDAYARATLGGKHPWALGRPAREVWAEIWPDIGPRIQSVLDSRGATWDERLLLFLERSGYREETYHTFSYSPLQGPDERVAGILCVVSEETDRVIGERRMATLRSLASGLAGSRTEPEVLRAVQEGLIGNRYDLPFSLVYLFEGPNRARLACAAGIASGQPGAPELITADDIERDWPLPAHGDHVVVESLAERFSELPTGEWEDSPRSALVAALGQHGDERPTGLLIAGLNPYRPFDSSYSGFIGLLAGQVEAGIAGARAYEYEQERARALTELDRAKTQFFSNVSHELRTPLTLIMAPAEDGLLDEQHPLPAPQRERMEIIRRNAGRLRRMVNDILDFSRIEGGRMGANLTATDLAAFTRLIVASFAPAIERAGLELRENLATLSRPVLVDLEMWEKVALNLLSNALKFTLAGHISISLCEADELVELEVSDSGIGIPGEEIPRLFERFHRVSEARGRSHEGSGIGLALVHELVGLHDGVISVQSDLGSGSSFRVRIPYGQDTPAEPVAEGHPSAAAGSYLDEALSWQEDALSEAVTPAPAEQSPHGSGGTVLVVDDNADLRSMLARLLSSQYTVWTAGDGEQALELIRQQAPDLILADVMMPRLDGFGLVRALREDRQTASLPVILLSARAGDEAAIGGLEAGADEYIVKPFSPRELVARIHSSMELSAVRREAADALRSERHRLEQTLEQLPVGVLLAEAPSGRIVLANKQVSEILGQPPGEESYLEEFGSHVRLTLDGEPLPLERWPLARAIRDGEVTHDLDLIYRGHRGHQAIVRVNSSPIRDEHGKTFAGVVVFQDVTTQARSQRLLSTQRDILARIAQGEPLEGTLTLIVRNIEALIESDARASILLRSADGARLELGAAPNLPKAYNEAIDGIEIGEGVGSCGTAAHRGEPVIVTDITTDPLWADFRDLAAAHHLRACWSTPIDATDGEVVGTFAIYYSQPRAPGDRDRQLIALMAETAAVAVERDRAARARERQFNEMQSSLLPRALARVPGIEVAARFRPGTRGLEVGGDFYDIFPLGESTWGFVIGDVCGHGAAAAAATAIARHTTRAVALREPESGRVLAAVHEALYRSDLDRFCTAIYGRLELTDAGVRLRFSNGGHPAPLILRSSGKVEHPQDHGPLLGVLSPAHGYPTVDLELEGGDAVVMYTDGLTERNPRLPTEEQLGIVLASVVGLPAEELIQRLEAESIANDPPPARDDMAVLILRVTPQT